MNAVRVRLRFVRHFFQLLLKFNRKENKESPPNININALIEEILKSTHTCREALNSSLSTVNLGYGYGQTSLFQFEFIQLYSDDWYWHCRWRRDRNHGFRVASQPEAFAADFPALHTTAQSNGSHQHSLAVDGSSQVDVQN